MKKRYFLIGLNLIAPGIGQMAGGYPLRGVLELMGAVFLFLWCLAEALGPVVKSMVNLISGNGDILCINLWRVGASIVLLIALYIFSIVEMALLSKDEE